MRCRLSFAILRATNRCVHGSRVKWRSGIDMENGVWPSWQTRLAFNFGRSFFLYIYTCMLFHFYFYFYYLFIYKLPRMHACMHVCSLTILFPVVKDGNNCVVAKTASNCRLGGFFFTFFSFVLQFTYIYHC